MAVGRLTHYPVFFFPHSHPSDLKHRFHRHQSSGSLHSSFNHNHVPDTSLPLVAEEHDENHDKGGVYDPKQDVFVSLFVSSLRLSLKTNHNQFSTLDNSKQNLQSSWQLVPLFCQMAAEQLAYNVAMFVVPASELYLAVSLLL